MNPTLELIIISLSILGSLVLGQLLRDYNFRLVQDKLFGLLAGVIVGLVLKFFSLSILDWLPGYSQYLLYFFLLEKVFTLPKVRNR